MKGFLSLSYSVAVGFNIWTKILLLSASIDELVSVTCEIWQKTDGDGSWTETLSAEESGHFLERKKDQYPSSGEKLLGSRFTPHWSVQFKDYSS